MFYLRNVKPEMSFPRLYGFNFYKRLRSLCCHRMVGKSYVKELAHDLEEVSIIDEGRQFKLARPLSIDKRKLVLCSMIV